MYLDKCYTIVPILLRSIPGTFTPCHFLALVYHQTEKKQLQYQVLNLSFVNFKEIYIPVSMLGSDFSLCCFFPCTVGH